MRSTQLRTGWGALVATLVDSEGQGVRAQILLECVAREPWIQACGLWRRETDPESWTCVLVRGLPEQLHDVNFIEEVAAGRTPPDLVPGRGVLLSGQAAGALALTYAGTPESEFDLDLVAGLLHVTRLIDAAEQGQRSARGEAFVPALPRSPAQPIRDRRAPLDCEPAALLEAICRSGSEVCPSRIRCELDLETGLEKCRLPIPAQEFVHAVESLVSNAQDVLEHKQAGGLIRVSLRRTRGDYVLVTVEDNGPGLPKEILDGLKRRGPEDLPGPGLGLAVTWGIALSAGGCLRVAESSAHGTRLEILLPVARHG